MKIFTSISLLIAILALVLRNYDLTLAAEVTGSVAAVVFVVGLAAGEER